jgi:hypothetical protein
MLCLVLLPATLPDFIIGATTIFVKTSLPKFLQMSAISRQQMKDTRLEGGVWLSRSNLCRCFACIEFPFLHANKGLLTLLPFPAGSERCVSA